MKRKAVSGTVLMLLLTSMLALALNIQPVKTEPTTIVVPDDYPTIQKAINNAREGDTIFVKSGIYHENVVVNKTVTILGESTTTTIIGSTFSMGARFEVLANNVTIAGFTMRWAYYGILSRSSYNLFYNNLIVAMHVYGICVSGGFSIITNNTIHQAGVGGIEFFGANNNLVPIIL